MIANCTDYCFPKCNEWIILFLGTFFWSAILYLIRPNLKIEKIVIINENGKDRLKIKVKNNNLFFNVTNLMVESCIVVGNKTCHLKLDKYDFIMLPPKKEDTDFHERDFKTIGLENPGYADGIGNIITNENYVPNLINYENYIIRIRVHANHSLSGLGKAFEKKFKWNKKSERFEKI
jgi:hypothetical protein